MADGESGEGKQGAEEKWTIFTNISEVLVCELFNFL